MGNTIITAFLIAIGLAMDCFAVSIGVGTGQQVNDRRSKLRLAFHFGLFQGGMTLIGWLAGSTIADYISAFDHWLALALLGYVGLSMIRNGFSSNHQNFEVNPSKGRMMVVLSVATSIDAMAVGLSMAMIKTPVFFASIVIGIVSFALSIFGLTMGNKLGKMVGKRMEIAGGVILLVIGIRIVVSHVL